MTGSMLDKNRNMPKFQMEQHTSTEQDSAVISVLFQAGNDSAQSAVCALNGRSL
jgi:hypothetical protein